MSSYGTALVIDSPEADASSIAKAVASWGGGGYVVVYVDRSRPAGEGLVRLTAYLSAIELMSRVSDLMSSTGALRAVLAEHYDEFGALWAVLAATGDRVSVVHRRYVLNADPDDPEEVALAIRSLETNDPRAEDVAGPAAAASAAELFGLEPSRMQDAEQESASAWEELGVIGGPFPWWDAMGLNWPGPDAGAEWDDR